MMLVRAGRGIVPNIIRSGNRPSGPILLFTTKTEIFRDIIYLVSNIESYYLESCAKRCVVYLNCPDRPWRFYWSFLYCYTCGMKIYIHLLGYVV